MLHIDGNRAGMPIKHHQADAHHGQQMPSKSAEIAIDNKSRNIESATKHVPLCRVEHQDFDTVGNPGLVLRWNDTLLINESHLQSHLFSRILPLPS